MIQLWDDIRKVDPLFGTGRNQAHFDEEADEKIRKAIVDGVLDPWKNPEHCQYLCCYVVGRYFGLRGMQEITYLRFELVGHGVFGPKYGSLNGQKCYVIRVPFDKTNKLSLLNVTTRPIQHQYIKVAGDPTDTVFDPVKFLDHYFSKCHPESTRFFGKIASEKQKAEFVREGHGDIWYCNAHSSKSNSVIGINQIRSMTKTVAELAGFDSWEKCTNHGNRAYALTKMIEAGAPLEDRMIFMRHKSANSQQPYARSTATRETNRHLALRASSTVDDLKPPAVPKPEAIVPKQVTKGVHGFQMGGGPTSLSTSTVPPTVDLTEWEEFQKFKAFKAGQCQSVAAPAAASAIVPPAIPDQVASNPMAMMNNSMSMMNPMSSMMMNPMMGMGMMNPMMNPMMGMGMMNPMVGMQNPFSIGMAMGMSMAQQNGNNFGTGNRANNNGDMPLNPNNGMI